MFKNITLFSSYPLWDEPFKRIFLKWLRKRLKKKKNFSINFFIGTNSILKMSVLNLSPNVLLMFTRYNWWFYVHTRILFIRLNNYIKFLILTQTYKILVHVKSSISPNSWRSSNLVVDLAKKQMFITILSFTVQCLWNCSTGIVLKSLSLELKKYLKKQYNFWLIFLKAMAPKLLSFLAYKNNVIIIKGQHKKFIKLLVTLWKINVLNQYNYIALRFNLPFTKKKVKIVKAIKRKLTKKFVKLNFLNNVSTQKYNKTASLSF